MYNFDEIINREGTDCLKYDIRNVYFGNAEVLPMWVADMDFATPEFIREAIIKKASEPIYGYGIRPQSWYDAIINRMQKRYNWQVKKNEIAFAPGVVPAFTMLIEALTNPGDKVIIQPPVYHPFFNAVTDNGRQLIENPLIEKNNRYTIDFDDLERKIDSRTKVLLLSSPHNPVGRVWTAEELEKLGTICVKHKLTIISDEVHSDLTLPKFQFIPTATVSETIANQTITIIAPSKTFNLAGLSTAVVIAQNKVLMQAYNNKLSDWHINQGNIFGTVALEAAYNRGDEWLEALLNYLQNNIDYLHNFLAERVPKITFEKPEATYLIWLNFKQFGLSQKELNDKLINEALLGLNNGVTFGKEGEGYMRINLACPLEVVKEACNRLEKVFGHL